MKKILINFLGIDCSGPVFTYEMAVGLAKNKYEVYVLISEDVENIEEWFKSKWFKKVLAVKTHKSKWDYIVNTVLYNYNVPQKVKKELGDICFDCVVRTFPHPMLSAVEKYLNIKKNVTICHDPIPHSGSGIIPNMRDWIIMRQADNLIVLTKKYKEIASIRYRKAEKNIYYMPHGLMSRYKEKQQVKKVYIKNKINFLFFGRIEKYKGIEILGEAFKRLEQEYTNIALTIAGKGDLTPYKQLLHSVRNLRVENRYIKDEEVGNFFDSENVIVVIPYLDATQSGVIPIALEYGNVIIASAAEGLVEQLNDGKVGVFFKKGNVDDLYAKMKILVSDNDMRKKEQKKSIEYSEELRWENTTKVFENILDTAE